MGGTAPTGAIDIQRRTSNNTLGNFPPLHYGMQLGSGTWDFKPSLTYNGAWEDINWGVQATSTQRLEHRNEQGYVLGDNFQSSVWGGYRWSDWLSTTVRGVYTWQGKIRGHYPDTVFPDGTSATYLSRAGSSNGVGTTDVPANYGGQFVDLGLGVNVTIPSGTFAGNTIKLEWLQPVHTDFNGYQLDRDYSLNATWSVGF